METTEPISTDSNEQPSPQAMEEVRAVKKRRSIWRRAGLVLLWLLLIVLVLGFGSGLVIQLPFFRHFIVSEIAGAIETGTNGTLNVGDIQGNLLKGFVMKNVTLHLKTGTAYDSIPLIHVDRIIATYSLFRWLRTSEIEVSSLVLQNPVVHLVKFAGDTNWNYSLFGKASTSKVPSKPFTQIIDLASLQIQNGSVSMRDYNNPSYPTAASTNKGRGIDWNDVVLQGIDLDGLCTVHGTASQSARIRHLQFSEKNSGFFVQRLGFSASLDSNTARIENAKIVTGHSNLGFSIEISPPKIIETGLVTSLQHSSVKATVSGPVISTYELKQFFPKPLGFLSGSPGIDLTATGEFGKLHIKKLGLDFRNQGNIVISGDMNNLHQPDSLTMNLDLHAKDLSNTTLNSYVPGLHIPDLSRFGIINISDLTFNGAPQNFRTKFDAKSSGAGNVVGDVTLDIRRKEIVYRADAKTTNFNIAALAPGPDLESSITAETHIAGHGTNWRTMSATITAKTDGPSTWTKYHVASLDLSGSVKSGTITTDHLDAIIQGGPELHVKSAMVALTSPEILFRFDGAITNLLLGQIFDSLSDNSARIDLDANIEGTAKEFNDLTGTAQLRLFDLTCQDYPLPDDTANLTISVDGSGAHKLILNSTIADVSVSRRFRMGDLIHVLPNHLNALLTALKNRDFSQRAEVVPTRNESTDSIDFDYRVQIKDLRSFADFYPQTFLLGEGALSGNIHGSAQDGLNVNVNGDSVAFIVRDRPSLDSDVAISADSGSAKAPAAHRDTAVLALPKFGSGTPRIQLMPTTFHLALDNLSNDSLTALSRLEAKLDFITDSVIRLGSALLYHPSVALTYADRELHFKAGAVYNNALALNLRGSSRFPNGDVDCTLDTLRLSYKNPYFNPSSGGLREFLWRNDGPAHIQLSKNGVLTIDSISILHPLSNLKEFGDVGAQRMSIGGVLHGDSVHAWANFPSFALEDLRKILPMNPNAGAFDLTKYSGTIRNFRATLSGTLEQPDITANLFADSIRYKGESGNEITFDSNSIAMEYRDQELRGAMYLHVANVSTDGQSVISIGPKKRSELRATIDSIPMVIALTRGPSYSGDSTRASTRPLSASIRAEQFPLDIATPFLAPFQQILGTGDINFTINGTRQNIEYAGTASIQNGKLLVASTNMWYLFGGSLDFAHNALVLENDTIRNFSSDDPLGMATLNGKFTFDGFAIKNFDLQLRSNRIMVLSDASKETLPTAYGTLTINTGGQNFRFYNTFEEPWIQGTINIMNANITMPETDNGPSGSGTGTGAIYETIPRDSIQPTDTIHAIVQTLSATHAASVRMNTANDSLFPNYLKDIYRNDNGSTFNDRSSATMEEAPQQSILAPSFTDKLRMDLKINTEGPARLTIPFGGGIVGVLGSQLKAELKSGGSLQIERGDDLHSIANGGFELSPNSTFTYISNFNIAEGSKVGFTRNFSNPTLNITADYIGTHHPSENTTDLAKIELTISGTKDKPVITAMNYEQISGEWETRQEQSSELAVEDAIYFLTTGGYFKSDLTNANSGPAAAKMLPALGGQVAANLAANIIGSTTQEFAIRSASLSFGNYGGAQITGAIRDVTIKLGSSNNGTGQVAGFNSVIDIPFTDIPLLSADFYHNMMFELQVNSIPTVGTLTQQPIWLTKVIYNLPLP